MRPTVLYPWLGLTAMLTASILLPLPGDDGRIAHLPSVCPFYHLTGLPCPACGLTRAFVSLGHGHFLASLQWHPLGWFLYLFCIFLWLRLGLTWLHDRPVAPFSSTVISRFSWSVLGALFLVGGVRIGWILLHHSIGLGIY